MFGGHLKFFINLLLIPIKWDIMEDPWVNYTRRHWHNRFSWWMALLKFPQLEQFLGNLTDINGASAVQRWPCPGLFRGSISHWWFVHSIVLQLHQQLQTKKFINRTLRIAENSSYTMLLIICIYIYICIWLYLLNKQPSAPVIQTLKSKV